MTTPLTPHQIIADLAALDRMAHDWLIEGRLDAITEAEITGMKADLMDDLRTRFGTRLEPVWNDWHAWQEGATSPIAYGKTEIEAIKTLLELIGEDA